MRYTYPKDINCTKCNKFTGVYQAYDIPGLCQNCWKNERGVPWSTDEIKKFSEKWNLPDIVVVSDCYDETRIEWAVQIRLDFFYGFSKLKKDTDKNYHEILSFFQQQNWVDFWIDNRIYDSEYLFEDHRDDIEHALFCLTLPVE